MKYEEHAEGYEACLAAERAELCGIADLMIGIVTLEPDVGVIGWDWMYNPNGQMIEDDGDFESTSAKAEREAKERAEANTQRRSDSLRNHLKIGHGYGAKRWWIR